MLFFFCRRILTGSIIIAACIVNWVNNYNYPYAHNFMNGFSHVVAIVCGMFVLDLCILFVLLARYVHCCDLSNVM